MLSKQKVLFRDQQSPTSQFFTVQWCVYGRERKYMVRVGMFGVLMCVFVVVIIVLLCFVLVSLVCFNRYKVCILNCV